MDTFSILKCLFVINLFNGFKLTTGPSFLGTSQKLSSPLELLLSAAASLPLHPPARKLPGLGSRAWGAGLVQLGLQVQPVTRGHSFQEPGIVCGPGPIVRAEVEAPCCGQHIQVHDREDVS